MALPNQHPAITSAIATHNVSLAVDQSTAMASLILCAGGGVENNPNSLPNTRVLRARMCA